MSRNRKKEDDLFGIDERQSTTSKRAPLKVVEREGGGYDVEDRDELNRTYLVTRVTTGGYHCPCKSKGYCGHVRAVIAFEIAQEASDIRVLEENAISGTPALEADRKLELGYDFGEVTSAMQKEIRAGNEELAVYWGILLYKKSPQYAWKRVSVCSCEDVGLADPAAVGVVCSLAQAWKFSRETSWYVSPHHLVMAIMLLCRAKKSVEVDDLINLTLERIKQRVTFPILDHYADMHTAAGKAQGKGDPHWYLNRHTTSGIPTNRYTFKYWQIAPDHAPDPEEMAKFGLSITDKKIDDSKYRP